MAFDRDQDVSRLGEFYALETGTKYSLLSSQALKMGLLARLTKSSVVQLPTAVRKQQISTKKRFVQPISLCVVGPTRHPRHLSTLLDQNHDLIREILKEMETSWKIDGTAIDAINAIIEDFLDRLIDAACELCLSGAHQILSAMHFKIALTTVLKGGQLRSQCATNAEIYWKFGANTSS